MTGPTSGARADRRARLALLLSMTSVYLLWFSGLPAVALGLAAARHTSPVWRMACLVAVCLGGMMSLMTLVWLEDQTLPWRTVLDLGAAPAAAPEGA